MPNSLAKKINVKVRVHQETETKPTQVITSIGCLTTNPRKEKIEVDLGSLIQKIKRNLGSVS